MNSGREYLALLLWMRKKVADARQYKKKFIDQSGVIRLILSYGPNTCTGLAVSYYDEDEIKYKHILRWYWWNLYAVLVSTPNGDGGNIGNLLPNHKPFKYPHIKYFGQAVPTTWGDDAG